MQLCRIIYYSLAALHVSSDIFRSSSGASKLYYSFWYYTRMFLPAGIMGVLAKLKIFLSVLMFHLRFYPTNFHISVGQTELPLQKNLKYNYTCNMSTNWPTRRTADLHKITSL